MTFLDHSQVRAQNIAAMGVEAGELYTDLHDEILVLIAVWREYKVLFGTSESRVNFLNAAAVLCVDGAGGAVECGAARYHETDRPAFSSGW